jgi:hypothetical protein
LLGDEEDLFNEPEPRLVDPLSLPLDTYRDLTRARRRAGGRFGGGRGSQFGANQLQVYSVPSRRPRQNRVPRSAMAEDIFEYYEPLPRSGLQRQRPKVAFSLIA